MSKTQFKNLWRCYRKGIGLMTRNRVLGWIGYYSKTDRLLIEKLIY
jgi:hypothetical protein